MKRFARLTVTRLTVTRLTVTRLTATRLAALAISPATLVALGAALAPAAAMAQVQTYYRAGAWEAFSGRNEKGGAVCGIGSTNPTNGRRLSISFDIGGTDTTFSASKPDWSIPDNTRVPVVMQIGLNTPWTEQGAGHEHTIQWTLAPGVMPTFDQQFRGASSMTLTFPDGNEPPWTVSLAGSTAISDTITRCVRDLTRQTQAVQPPANAAPPAQGATQPFSPPEQAPPPR
jgi:hypothetical protein